MLIALLVASLGLIAFCYVGYPLLVAMQARFSPRPVNAGNWQPHVDVIVVAYNASESIARKIDNLLALDYPADRLKLRLGSDGSSDDTVQRARAHVAQRGCENRVSIEAFPMRRGKAACLADLIAQADSDVLFFTDVRQRVEPVALKALLHPLADQTVGAVSGELMFERADGFAGSVDAYWRYEKFIRRNESASGSVVGVTGAIWAARRDALSSIPAGIILDDVWLPLAIAKRGLRVLFCGEAIAWDKASTEPAQEALRKRRTLAGNFQLIANDPSLLWPGSHPLGWRLWGHKWLRLASPWLFVIALLTNVLVVAKSPWLALLLALQLLGWIMAAVTFAQPSSQRFLPLRIAALFARMNLYAAQALFDFIRNRDAHLWSSSTVNPERPR
ncbi:MAG: glycosyltransferase family 2 protein [Dokdonella sp.]